MPAHRFFLLPGDGHWPDDWGYEDFKRRLWVQLRREDAVELPMDFYPYIADTLAWIPSVNPANPRTWPGYGLDQFGQTIVNKDGAAKFEHVFGSWAALFAGGPERIRITGGATSRKEGGVLRHTGEFARYEFDRDPLVANLRMLARYGTEVRSAELFIVHLGI